MEHEKSNLDIENKGAEIFLTRMFAGFLILVALGLIILTIIYL